MFGFFTDREIAELSFWWAGVAMPLVTFGVILYARAQLTVIANQAQATLLLNLVDKWNSEAMLESRKLFRMKQSETKEFIFSQHVKLNDQESKTKLNERFNVVIDDLYKNDLLGDYTVLMRMMNFIETIGLLVGKGYISVADVDGLFRGPICQCVAAFKSHITSRQKEKDVTPGLCENALSLFRKIEEICPK
jgi:hypothetical protein